MQRHHFLSTFGLGLAIAGLAFSAPPAAPGKVREPAVAGLFYPRDRGELSRAIDSYLAAAKPTAPAGRLVALICPHAGYPYSGPVAAHGFRLLAGRDFEAVLLLAPSHYAALTVASVSDATVFRTPLGDVPISPKARALAQVRPFALEPRCDVERPAWAAQSSRTIPAAGAESADTWEHSDEVEVPFLQKTLAKFTLLPVVFGDVDPAAAARALAPHIDAGTLIVASSDLSHYHPYAKAQELDRACIDAICRLDVEKMAGQEACGRVPILTLMHVAKQRGWQPVLLDYRNSGDTAGDKARVVGYAAIAFYSNDVAPAGSAATASELSAAERRYLLQLARQSLQEATARGQRPAIPAAEVTPALRQPKACFVTLTQAGALRGCIGHLTAQMPLYRAVIENARSAALEDPRFPAVTSREAGQLSIEISVLSEPQPLAFSSPEDLLRQLQPHRDGVVLQLGAARATYLPQVWEQIPDKVEFLDSLAAKAGLRAGDWRRRGAAVSIYHVESFTESDH